MFYLWNVKDFLQILLSGSKILLTKTLELRMVLQNIWRWVVGDVLTDISPPTIFLLNYAFSCRILSKLSGWFGHYEHKWIHALLLLFHALYIQTIFSVGTSMGPNGLTFMLLVANSGQYKMMQKSLKNDSKPWHVCTHLRVLRENYPMNTNMTGFIWFLKNLCVLDF